MIGIVPLAKGMAKMEVRDYIRVQDRTERVVEDIAAWVPEDEPPF